MATAIPWASGVSVDDQMNGSDAMERTNTTSTANDASSMTLSEGSPHVCASDRVDPLHAHVHEHEREYERPHEHRHVHAASLRTATGMRSRAPVARRAWPFYAAAGPGVADGAESSPVPAAASGVASALASLSDDGASLSRARMAMPPDWRPLSPGSGAGAAPPP